MTPLTIAGSINQDGSSVRSAVRVVGSTCFDQLTTVSLAGTLTGSNILLTSTSVTGQIVSFTGSVTGDSQSFFGSLTGTYAINGGCADGDQGNITGVKIPQLANQIIAGTFTSSEKETFDVAGEMTQNGTSSSEGSFGITGTVTFNKSCLSSGTIKSGAFPSGSFIMGTSLALEIHTDNGVVDFLGTESLASGEISGNYTVLGGTCDQTGTAVLVENKWDY